MSDLVFAADAETTMTIAPETQALMLESLARFEIEAFERARAVAAPRSPEVAALDLRREEALQTTLRQAIYLGHREVAQRPLRHVAAHLGIELDEADEDWTALAYQATRVLLDVSQERSRRQQGIYGQPTLVFRRAVSTAEPAAGPQQTAPAEITVAPAVFASNAAVIAPVAPAPASFATENRADTPKVTPAAEAPSGADQQQDAPVRDEPSAGMPSLKNSTSPAPPIVPAGFDLPEGYDEQSWQKARVAARPPRILIDKSLLSDRSREAIEKQRESPWLRRSSSISSC
ncbi:MAG: hypothetical protein M5U35_05250 [Roseovarius sp.]|nr:hypothetical protein [Roseovarius sp.]